MAVGYYEQQVPVVNIIERYMYDVCLLVEWWACLDSQTNGMDTLQTSIHVPL